MVHNGSSQAWLIGVGIDMAIEDFFQDKSALCFTQEWSQDFWPKQTILLQLSTSNLTDETYRIYFDQRTNESEKIIILSINFGELYSEDAYYRLMTCWISHVPI